MLVLETIHLLDGFYIKAHCSVVLVATKTPGMPSYLYTELTETKTLFFEGDWDRFRVNARSSGVSKERTNKIVETIILHSAFSVYKKSI